jgi:predicted RNA binding protein YcfA (HicA-like mRNA interferase family)
MLAQKRADDRVNLASPPGGNEIGNLGFLPEGRRMDSKKIIRALRAAGWVHDRTRGSHHVLVNPATGRIAVVPHPRRDLPIGTVKKLERDTGLKF